MSEEVVDAPSAPLFVPAEPATPKEDAPPAASGEPAQNPAEPAPAKTEPAPGEGKNRLSRKLDRAYRERAEAQARAEFFESQLKEFQAKANPPKADGAPRLEDFSDIQEYAKAYAEHEKQQTFKQLETRHHQQSAAKQRAELVAGWEQKSANAKYEDFDEVVGDLQPTTPWAVAVMEADNGDEIAYYLGTHLDEAKAIAALSPTAQIRAIGKLEAKLAAEPAKPSPTSKAPAPINPVSGTGSPPAPVDPKTESFEAFMKRRNKELGRK